MAGIGDSALGTTPAWRGIRRWIAVNGVVAVGYQLSVWAALALAIPATDADLPEFWLPTGVSLAAALLCGPGIWPGIFIGAFAADVMAGLPPSVALPIDIANVAEALIAAWLLRRMGIADSLFDSARSIFLFLLVVIACAASISAPIGLLAFALGGLADPVDLVGTGLRWVLGNAAGGLLVAPIILMAFRGGPGSLVPRNIRTPEIAAFALALTVAVDFAHGGITHAVEGDRSLPLVFLAMPCIVWAGFRLGTFLTAVAIAGVAALSAMYVRWGLGPFAVADPGGQVLLLQAYSSVVSLTGLVVAASVREGVLARDALETTLRQRESVITERTRELAETNRRLQREFAEHRRTARINDDHRHILQLLATGATLEHILKEIAGQVERHDGEGHCAILTPESAAGQWSVFTTPTMPANVLGRLAETLAEDAPGNTELDGLTDLARGAGGADLALVRARAVRIGDGALAGVVAVFRDRTSPYPAPVNEPELAGAVNLISIAIEHQRSARELVRMANHDALSGLPNRHAFMETLRSRFAAAQTNGESLALLFVDLDEFKAVNDRHGHAVGDAVIVEAARRLRDAVRPEDYVARLGGDEFVVIVHPVEQAPEVRGLAERLITTLAARYHSVPGAHPILPSVGLALGPDEVGSPEALLGNADLAMYAAKRAGGGTTRLFQPGMRDAERRRRRFGAEIEEAFETGGLCLVYQPQQALDAASPTDVEALLRWNHPALGVIAPDQFLATSTDEALRRRMTQWIVSEALRQRADWANRDVPGPRITVNLANDDLRDPSLVEHVRDALAEHDLEPWALGVEIAEVALNSATATMLHALDELHEIGVGLIADRFGADNTNLRRLRRGHFDTLKIDRGLIRAMASDPNADDTVRALIALARSLQLSTVAVGVEDRELLPRLAAMGCDRAQGFAVAEPTLPSELDARWLRQVVPS